MNCLSDKRLNELADLNGFISKDDNNDNLHIEDCNSCSTKIEQYKLLEKTLNKGFFIEPPASITEFVMSKILAKKPSFQSLIISIFISIASIIFMIFAYYGFAKDSLLKGTMAFGSILFDGLHSIVLSLSALFDYSIVFVETLNKLTKIVLGVGADIELIGLLFVVILTGIFFTFYKLALKVKLLKGALG